MVIGRLVFGARPTVLIYPRMRRFSSDKDEERESPRKRLRIEKDGTDLSFHQNKYAKSLLDAVTPFLCDEMKHKSWDLFPKREKESSLPTLDPRIDALNVLDLTLKKTYEMGFYWEELQKENMRLPIAVNCGISGSGKTVQLTLAMHHFETSPSPGPRGKTLYITFNGGLIAPDVKVNAANQNCDIRERPDIRVYARILYSAVCRHGVKYPVGLSNFAAVILPPLKSLGEACPMAVVQACRSILQLKPEENVLIAADELAKLGEEGQVGVVSENAVLGLKALVELSTASMIDRRGNAKLGALYVCGSAYAAYNPAMGVTVGSNRPVFYMPLPPLSVERDDEKLKRLYDGPALTFARTLLWSSQYNARDYTNVLRMLVGETAKQIIDARKSKTCEIADVPHENENNFLVECDTFLRACDVKSVNPMELLRSLFWPLPFNSSTTAFHEDFHAALLADAAGLCTILRDNNAGVDRVYMSPKAAEQLAVKLKSRGQELDPVDLSFVEEVRKLAQALQKMPASPGDTESGKLFEVVVLLAYRCRAASMREQISIDKFLGCFKCTIDGHISLRPLQGAIKELSPVTVFPRASVKGREVFESLPDEQKKNGKASNEDWYNWDPTSLPSPTQHSEGWSSPVLAGMHKYNAILDGLLALPTARNGKPVLFGFQTKERMNPMDGEEFRRHRRTHLTWTPAVRHTLDVYQFVHVLVETNWCANSMELKAEVDPNIDEAIVSSIYTLNWCPTVAYSNCSAPINQKLSVLD